MSCRIWVGGVDAVQDHVGNAQHVGQGFFFDPANGCLQDLLVPGGFDKIFAFVIDGAGQKAAGAAGRIEDRFLQPGIDPVYHEPGHRAGGIKLPGIAGALQILENLFINIAEQVAVFLGVEIDLADLVDHLAHQGAGFHIVVGILEQVPHHHGALALRAVGVEFVF